MITDTTTEFEQMKSKWQRCRDAVSGKDAIFSRGETYLPKLDQMTTDEYVAYQMRAGWYDATNATKTAFLGMLMRTGPKIDNGDGAAETLLDDITLSGQDIKSFISDLLSEVVEVGRVGILVDHETMGDGPMTRAEVERANMRPYFTSYKAEQILPPRMGYVNNKYTLTQLRLKETVPVPGDTEFDTDYIDQIRVLDLSEGRYRVRLFRSQTKNERSIEYELYDTIFPKMNGEFMSEIPFIFINSTDLSHELSKPPLLGLAEMNIDYYRTKADYKHGLHFTGLPTAVITGYRDDDNKHRIGSTVAWQFKNPDADAKFLEFTGKGLGEIADELERLGDGMAALGARLLASQKRASETAQAHLIKRTGEFAKLADIANTTSRGVNRAFKILSRWAQLVATPQAFVNTDFVPLPMESDDVIKIVKAAQSEGAYTWEDALWALGRGEALSPNLSDDERLSRMETTPPEELDTSNPDIN